MSNKPVLLFIPCIMDGIYPEAAEAVVRLFQGLGVETAYPMDQTCCGQPAFNSGFRLEAAVAAKHFMRTFEGDGPIVCPSGSCVNMVRHHYGELFADDPKWLGRARSAAGRIFELTEYLVDVLGAEDTGARYEGIVTYHDSCHLLRGLGVSEQPRRLIGNVRGIEFVEMKDPDRCCGFGGGFSFKFGEISTAILEDKIKSIVDCGAGAVIGCDMGCLMNIQGMLDRKKIGVKVMHIAQLLAPPPDI